MKSKVVFVVVFYTYLCSNRVASIPISQDSARYLEGAYPTSGLSSSFNTGLQADIYSQNLVAQNARNQRQYEIQQYLNAQQTNGQNQVNNYQNQIPLSFLRQNKFQELNSYRGINQGSIGNSAKLQQSQPSNVLNQNPSQVFLASEGINNQALIQRQQVSQPLYGVYQQPTTVSRNNLNNQQFLANFPGNGSPVQTGNGQTQNRYALVYPERRFEYTTDIEAINRQFQNRINLNNKQELPPVSLLQPTPFPVPTTLTYSIPTPKPSFTPTNIVSPRPTFTSVPASPTPIPAPTTATSQAFKPLNYFDINEIIAQTKRFSQNAAKEARLKAISQIEASNSIPKPIAASTSTNTPPVTSSSSGTSTSAASQTVSSVPAYIAPSTSTESTLSLVPSTPTCPTLPVASTTPLQTAAPVFKSGRKGAVSWFSTSDPDWLNILLEGDNKGLVFFVKAPSYDAPLDTTN